MPRTATPTSKKSTPPAGSGEDRVLKTAGEDRPRIGSLCTGIAGLDMGVAAALGGARLSWVADPDPAASRFLRARFPAAPNLGDIRRLDWGRVEPVEVLTIGFPCQDISVSGRAAGIEKGASGGVWAAAVEAVRRLRPDLVVVENVAALRSRGLGRVLGDLARTGYDARWTSLRAADVGAPHTRERVFAAAYPHRSGRGSGPLLGGRPQGPRRADQPARCDPPAGRDHGGGGWVQGELFPALALAAPDEVGPASEEEAREACPLSTPGAWGRYEAAVRRWEQVTGQAAPCPLEPGTRGGRRLNAAFTEWAMGFPAGWVSDPALGLDRNVRLRLLGNAVVPQQAEAATHLLLEAEQRDT
ncbi:DNA cytosine methyltransferase [Nocardiopsis composta]|uniref:DNA (cytosine-5-)-methyltransferase n=1 Tax=Nocardiopsis composta TaxID=157465 RepID=A0A7W8VG33_9ACTN|nr:DNA cytosine methyltransferase [Nocardiopsis composta]MBB5435221.1 DNA (cytosine-5)-methyltransferase 1 [Nocardiopsis composta]